MLIINATKSVKTIMTDRGDLVSIQPGDVSKLMIASKNLIIATMNLGTPEEIGIVISGSYELDIAKTISGAVPYLYTDLDEAKSKLIDDTIDYKSNLESSKNLAGYEVELKNKTNEIEVLKSKIDNLEDQLKLASADELKVELEEKINSLEEKLKESNLEKTRLESQLTESEEQLRIQSDNLNNTKKELGASTQDLSVANNKIAELLEQVDKLQSQLNELPSNDKIVEELEAQLKDYKTLESEYEELKKTNEDLKGSLSNASDTIESMKNEFNKACNMFGITRDPETGEWIQLVDEDDEAEEVEK